MLDVPNFSLPPNVPSLFIDTVVVGEEKYVYAIKYNFTWIADGPKIRWQADDGRALVIEPFATLDDLNTFHARISRISETTMTLFRRWNAETQTQSLEIYTNFTADAEVKA